MPKKAKPPIITREEATRFLVGNFDEWPKWPILPMIRGNVINGTIGVMVEEDEDVYNVYLCSMFEAKSKLGICEKETFATVDELMNAGWRVD